MRKNKKWIAEENYKIVSFYMNGEGPQNTLVKKFGCTHKMIGRWITSYRQYCLNGLQKRKTKRVYTNEFKRKLIKEVLNGNSQQEVLV
ncbi:helix-turn-helix domain-containing protein [Marinilactibacillus kalidii]|uniref:helix-turn-helix domain-containing protein n=1 Tax=Marinilactibacillus kalidii TaxID=2820274 RepID=UPI001ABED253|nr:helix-turn-helix domain-containing protein [Marinilactibacillus kalidii]